MTLPDAVTLLVAARTGGHQGWGQRAVTAGIRRAGDLGQVSVPHRESARALGALADRVRPTVLVADDEFQRKLMARILEAENYRVLFAGSGFEVLSLLRKTRPDLIASPRFTGSCMPPETQN